MIVYIYYAHLSSSGFEHSVCRGSLMIYNMKHVSVDIYIYIYIYIYMIDILFSEHAIDNLQN